MVIDDDHGSIFAGHDVWSPVALTVMAEWDRVCPGLTAVCAAPVLDEVSGWSTDQGESRDQGAGRRERGANSYKLARQ